MINLQAFIKSINMILQFTILTQLYGKYKIFLKVYYDKIINLLTFKIKYVKVLNGEELQSVDVRVRVCPFYT